MLNCLLANTAVIIDISVIVVLLLFTLIGIFRGFLRSLLSLFGSTVSLIVAYLSKNVVASLLEKLFSVTTTIQTKIIEYFYAASSTLTDFKSVNPSELKEVVNGSGLNGFLKKVVNILLGNDAYSQSLSVSDVLSPKIAHLATVALALVVSYALLRIVVFVLSRVFKKITTKLKTFGKIDRVFGSVFGLIKGAVFVVFAFAIIASVSYIPSQTEKIQSTMESTTISKPIYNKISEFIIDKLENYSG